MINGINPSIAKLVYYLNFYGIDTILSHAGFYPGDPEEQEYWIQKRGWENDFGIEFNGPYVLIGVSWMPPNVHIFVSKEEFDRLSTLLPTYWNITLSNFRPSVIPTGKTVAQIIYEHPRLLEFQNKFESLYWKFTEEYGNLDEINYTQDIIKKLNKIMVSNLPLNRIKHNRIRDNGIHTLEEIIVNEITNLNITQIKTIVDRLTNSSNYYDF